MKIKLFWYCFVTTIVNICLLTLIYANNHKVMNNNDNKPINHPVKNRTKVLLDSLFTLSIGSTLKVYNVRAIFKDNNRFEIIIKKSGTSKTLQSIHGLGIYEGEGDFEIIDVNSDGYKDFKILSNIGNTGLNNGYSFWLYNPHTGKFNHSEEFDNLFGANPTFDESGLVTEQSTETNCLCYDTETFKIIGTTKVLVRREAQTFDWDKQLYTRILLKLINGKLVEVKKKVMTREEAAADKEDWSVPHSIFEMLCKIQVARKNNCCDAIFLILRELILRPKESRNKTKNKYPNK